MDAGWNRQEVLEAAVELALAHLMADDENAKTDFAIAMARRQLHYERPATPELPEAERLAHAETFIANLGAKTEFVRGLLSPVGRHRVHAAIHLVPRRSVILWGVAA